MNLHGIYPALLSTFNGDYSFNFDNLAALVRKLSDAKVRGFYVGGTSSELFALTMDERKKIVETVRSAASKDCAMIVHIGAMNPCDAIELARHAAANGADAISAIPPFYCKYTWTETAAYYRTLMDAASIPMFLYNIPAFTGVNLTTAQYREVLASGKVAGVKHTSYNLYEMDRLKTANPDGTVLCGHDEIFCGALAMGADGCIGTSINAFPKFFQRIAAHLQANNVNAATALQSTVNELLEVFIELGFFASVKHIVSYLGVPTGDCRPPFQPLTADQKKRLEQAYDQCEQKMASLP